MSYTPNPGDTLVFENDRVRVWSMTLPPRGMYDWHQHHHDHLIIWPDPGRAAAQRLGEEEWPVRQTAEAGYVAFKTVGSGGPLTPHRIRNLEDHAVTHYIVELISEPSPSPVELPSETNDRGSAVDVRTGEPF
ncbi:hypothetical protein [Amycolatopsis thermalba]|uniref:hypothetical protein n=1 Tax=Amycolatopsis thermalba TaxID=944492 RepID=UPI000E223E43|nr:hypothetical protein [Amycolatopsis thermalba]